MINSQTYAPFNQWQPPTLKEVQHITNKTGLEPYELCALIGINNTSMKRWRGKSAINPHVRSKIPYAVWCLIVYIAKGKVIFSDVIEDADLSLVDKRYITALDEYESPPVNVMRKFVGKRSLTKLTRTPLAEIWGANPSRLLRNIAQGELPYIMWCLLLIFVGFDMREVIKNDSVLTEVL